MSEINNKLIPNRLKEGDLIGIVSPSQDITLDSLEVLNRGLKILNNFGLKIVFASNTGINNAGKVLTPKQKGEDITEVFANNEIDAVLCTRGGEGCNLVVPYIDYDVVKANPKIFGGFSDITHILNAIYSKTGLITFCCTNVKTLGEKLGDRISLETINDFKEKLFNNNFKFNHNTNWRCIRSGRGEGILIGGNLYCFTNLLNTEYCPSFEDKILFLEDLGMESTPEMVMDRLNMLKEVGAFDKIKGIWVGNYVHESGKLLEDMILEVTKEYSFPILKCDEFGHSKINVVIPVGGRAVLDADNLTIQIIDKVLK